MTGGDGESQTPISAFRVGKPHVPKKGGVWSQVITHRMEDISMGETMDKLSKSELLSGKHTISCST